MQEAALRDASVVIMNGHKKSGNCEIGAVVNSSFKDWKASAVVPFCHSSHSFLADREADMPPCCSSE